MEELVMTTHQVNEQATSERTFLNSEEQAICKQIAAGEAPHSHRALALLSLNENTTQTQAAEQAGLSIGQLKYWLAKFRKQRLGIFPANLLDKLDKEAEQAEVEVVSEIMVEPEPVKEKAESVKDKNKKTKVTGQFVEAFKAYSAWRGDLDIRSPEFLAMMDEARELVAKQDSAKAAVALETPETPTVTPPESKSKPWYKKWWVLGLGVGVVAVAAVALTGGGDDGDKEPPPDQTLSDFPDTPTR